MGGSPKRGKAAGGCMSRGRLILLAVLTVQLLLVVCLMKAPRLVFSGTSSRAAVDHLVGDDDDSAESGSWLWRKFVAENAKAQFSAKTPTTVRNCKDGNGRSVECENQSLRRRVRKIDASDASAHQGRPVRLPQESRLRRPGLITTRVVRDELRNGTAVEELSWQRRARGSGRSLPARDGSVAEESGTVLRQRRGSVESRLPARNGDRRVRSAAGDRLAATPKATREDVSISSQLRGSIGDSLERDSFRFRGVGGYGDHLRGEVNEQTRDIAPLEDDLSEDDSDDDAIARSEVSYAGRRASSQGPSFNATRRSNLTISLETSSEELLENSTIGLEELEDLTNVTAATAPGALLEAHNVGTPLDALLTANMSGVNATLGAQFGARNGTLGYALSANVSAINATLIELFGAHNATFIELFEAHNVTLIELFGAHNATLIELFEAHNVTLIELFGAHNATLIEHFGAHNATLMELFGAHNATHMELFGAHNATLMELFGAHNASLGVDALTANVSAINAALGELFARAQNASLEADALTTNVSGVQNATLGARFGAQNASLEVDALTANATGVQNATLSELFGAQNASLEDVDALTTNATLGARFGAHNASLEDVDALTTNATLGPRFGAHNASLEDVDALRAANVSGVQNASAVVNLVNVSDVTQNATCLRGLVYVHALPKTFNTELLENCLLQGQGYLKQSGANHSGEVIFHQRMLTHPCRTQIPELAKAFYIPYYGSLDVTRFLSDNATERNSTATDKDTLGGELVEWLARNPYWKRHQGADHFLMLQDRIKGNHVIWGSRSLNITMTNVTKHALEPWDDNHTQMAIPYPTGFHPRDDAEVVAWQTSLRKVRRDLLFSFTPRTDPFLIDSFEECKQATFCLQPRGADSRSIFDSLVAGCIPVFTTKSAYDLGHYYWAHLPTDYSSYSVFIDPKTDMIPESGALKIKEILQTIHPAKVQQMQETILALIPRLVYATPEHKLVKFKDAFDTTIDKVMANFDDHLSNHTVTSVQIKENLNPNVEASDSRLISEVTKL